MSEKGEGEGKVDRGDGDKEDGNGSDCDNTF